MINVLVVERDPALARLYREELEDAGFGVRVLRDLNSALADLRSKPAHVMVTDMASVGDRLEECLPRIRTLHGGPVLALGDFRRPCRPLPGVSMLIKSSDLRPLIRSLRGRAAQFMWSDNITGSC